MAKRSTSIARLGFGAAIFMFTSAESCEQGTRDNWGGCPEGEVCSSDTLGLHFVGPELGDGNIFGLRGPTTLAIGGRETIELFDHTNDTAELRPFSLAYDVRGEGSYGVESIAGNQFSLRGNHSGDDFVRVVNPADESLYDRHYLSVALLHTIRIRPATMLLLDDGATSSLYAPGSKGYISLVSADERELVDQDTSITGAGVAQTKWDGFEVRTTTLGTHQLQVTAGRGTSAVLEYTVAEPDEIRTVFGDIITLGLNVSQLVCFNARSAGRAMHAAITFEAVNVTLEPLRFDGCVMVKGDQLGVGSITVRSRGVAKTLSFRVIEQPPQPSGGQARTHGSPGERALFTLRQPLANLR